MTTLERSTVTVDGQDARVVLDLIDALGEVLENEGVRVRTLSESTAGDVHAVHVRAVGEDAARNSVLGDRAVRIDTGPPAVPHERPLRESEDEPGVCVIPHGLIAVLRVTNRLDGQSRFQVLYPE
ncbi:hypothetical protein [Leifsonia sp. PS1209]|uniref:hypothetical protein n=1 Tax=Leifsonia sp. PS1209 TaxID=2724914 RepID=UPI001442BDC6|nr:hypothetical protein [Leifsonia sp. PS1209]QIZ97753.1 hypothetical protein HF024_03920 [Leifsonia sp. PS1209]